MKNQKKEIHKRKGRRVNPSRIIKKDGHFLVELCGKNGTTVGFAKVSPCDVITVSSRRWSKQSGGYCHSLINGKLILMHNFILGFRGVDHVNMDKLDNRRENLRPATHSQNNMNRAIQKNNKSGIRGVYRRVKIVNKKTYKYWEAVISINRKQISLGCFSLLEDAKSVRRIAEKELFKEYAYREK